MRRCRDGNFANCIRYFPTQAFNLAFKDTFKNMCPQYDLKTQFVQFSGVNLVSGGLTAGGSLCIVYPLCTDVGITIEDVGITIVPSFGNQAAGQMSSARLPSTGKSSAASCPRPKAALVPRERPSTTVETDVDNIRVYIAIYETATFLNYVEHGLVNKNSGSYAFRMSIASVYNNGS